MPTRQNHYVIDVEQTGVCRNCDEERGGRCRCAQTRERYRVHVRAENDYVARQRATSREKKMVGFLRVVSVRSLGPARSGFNFTLRELLEYDKKTRDWRPALVMGGRQFEYLDRLPRSPGP